MNNATARSGPHRPRRSLSGVAILLALTLAWQAAAPADGKELARDYAVAIGDTPEIQAGQILVRNQDGRVIARVPQSVLEGGK